MKTLYTHQSANVRRTWALMTIFLIVIIGLGWFFSYYYGAPEILFLAVIFSIGMNLISYWNSDKIVLSIAGAKQLKKEDNKELWNILENLSIAAGLPMPKLYLINDSVPNAFATGRNKENASVAVTTGLLSILDRSELEGVLAHELAHIGNKDILLQTSVVVLVGFIALLSDFFIRISLFGGRGRDSGGGGVAIIGLILAILSPLVATLIQLAISRKREFLADASGSLLTRYPEGLASALEKISKHSRPMKRANRATAHLYISNPFGRRGSVGLFTKMFSTHPPVADRVRILRES